MMLINHLILMIYVILQRSTIILIFLNIKKIILIFQLKHFKVDMLNHPKLQKLSSIVELCRGLIQAGKSNTYYLINRLIRLVLTLLVSTATTKRAFSAIKIVKTRLRNKMEDKFLRDNLFVYIEREIAKSFNSDLILDGFISLRPLECNFRHFVFCIFFYFCTSAYMVTNISI
jgi:hypothetical protein